MVEDPLWVLRTLCGLRLRSKYHPLETCLIIIPNLIPYTDHFQYLLQWLGIMFGLEINIIMSSKAVLSYSISAVKSLQ